MDKIKMLAESHRRSWLAKSVHKLRWYYDQASDTVREAI